MAKTSLQQQNRIDEMMEQASAALVARDYFLCERLAAQALRRAHGLFDWERMARIILPLQEARRQKRDLARDAKKVFLVTDELPAGKRLVAGCYLITPPRVGIDGRLLREAADEKRVPIIVLVREPTTRDGLWPLVAVGPVTVRTKVAPPEAPAPTRKRKTTVKPKAAPASPPKTPPPTCEWMLLAGEALGDTAIAQVPADASAAVRADQLLMRLEAVPDHEKLHQRLEEACRQALVEPPTKRRPADAAYFDELDDEPIF